MLATRRVHVLVAPAPGAEVLALRVEAAVRRRGWVLAADAEDADALVLCGSGDADWAAAADLLWASVAPPRARRRIDAPDAVGPALDSVGRVLADRAAQREARRSFVPPVSAAPPAQGLHAVRFGPILRGWPTGLVVDCAVQRGAVVAADARVLTGAAPQEPLGELSRAFVRTCDRAAALLRFGGWEAEALRLARCIDPVLAGAALSGRRRAVRGALRRSRGSAILRSNLHRPDLDPRGALLELLSTAIRLCDGASAPDRSLDVATIAPLLLGRRVGDVRLAIATWTAVDG